MTAADRELFEDLLASFVPPEVFDVHAHLYSLSANGFDYSGLKSDLDDDVGFAAYRRAFRR